MQKDIKGILTQKVRLDQSALNMGSGTLEVFSTPSLVAFVEKTCWFGSFFVILHCNIIRRYEESKDV